MGVEVLDHGLRGGAIALFLMLALLFARDGRHSLTARLGAAMTVGAACYTALMMVDASVGFPNPWRVPLHLMSLATPALFWPFAASWFDDEFELRWYHWAFVVGTMLAGFAANFLFFVLHNPLAAVALGWRALSIASIALGLRATLRGWNADLVESRRRVRLVIACAVALAIAWIVVAELWSGWPPPIGWRVGNAVGLLVLAVTVAIATLGWRDPALLAAPPKLLEPRPPQSAFEDAPLLDRLTETMTRERLYRQDGLTITAVAAHLGVPEYRLRRAINQGLGARNFNAYLNSFRLREAAEALADPMQRDVPVTTIALDAGFGSLAPFNRAFREAQGCTPSEYRARHCADL